MQIWISYIDNMQLHTLNPKHLHLFLDLVLGFWKGGSAFSAWWLSGRTAGLVYYRVFRMFWVCLVVWCLD